MSKPALTQERLKELMHYDPTTGVFTRIITACPIARNGDVAGSLGAEGYVRIKIDGTSHRAHRLAWLYVYGYLPEDDIDHINRNRSKNSLHNLRLASQQCNTRNSKTRSDNTSGVVGVIYCKRAGKWSAKITVNGTTKHLCYNSDFTEAVAHRLAAEQYFDWSECNKETTAKSFIKNHVRSLCQIH